LGGGGGGGLTYEPRNDPLQLTLAVGGKKNSLERNRVKKKKKTNSSGATPNVWTTSCKIEQPPQTRVRTFLRGAVAQGRFLSTCYLKAGVTLKKKKNKKKIVYLPGKTLCLGGTKINPVGGGSRRKKTSVPKKKKKKKKREGGRAGPCFGVLNTFQKTEKKKKKKKNVTLGSRRKIAGPGDSRVSQTFAHNRRLSKVKRNIGKSTLKEKPKKSQPQKKNSVLKEKKWGGGVQKKKIYRGGGGGR